MRKSEMRDESALRDWERRRRRGVGIEVVSITTVVFGGRDVALEIMERAVAWI